MKQRTLFLCTGNSARSQMAEALLRLISNNHFDAFSAGTHPVGLNPYAIEAMQEIGVNISDHRSKHVNEFVRQPFDYVITVCDRANESCPVFSDARNMLHWSFEDPAAAPPTIRREVFRQVRDEIADRISKFLIEEAEITPMVLRCYRCSGGKTKSPETPWIDTRSLMQ